MGLIRAALNSGSSVLKDQWKEFFYCDALSSDTLGAAGKKKKSGLSQNKGDDNVISAGSVIAVADGQCVLIVDNGKVIDYCAEPGEYTYDASSEPSLLDGGKLGDNIKEVFKNIGKRFTFGAETPKMQKVYYFNVKELPGNKYGTSSPVPFRVVDERAGIDMDMSLRCHGEYSLKLTNPVLFYTNVCGNFAGEYKVEELSSIMKTELLTALQPAFAKISLTGVRYSQLPAHTTELATLLNEELSSKWRDLRGIEIVSFGVSSVTVSEEDEKTIKELQRNAAFTDPSRAAAYMVGSTGAAMQAAANNPNGAFTGFMGMNMAQANGGIDTQGLFAMGQQKKTEEGGWKCTCGAVNTGNFCSNCGAKNPNGPWTCTCGTVNTGNFCTNCGAKKPE